MSKSRAQKAFYSIVMGCPEQESVHTSIDLPDGKKFNFQFPASQLSNLIACLHEIKDSLEEQGVNVGDGQPIFRGPPLAWWQEALDHFHEQSLQQATEAVKKRHQRSL